MDGDAVQRGSHMQADEAAGLGQRLDVAVDDEMFAGQFAPPARSIGEQHAEAAFDVDRIVAPRGAGVERELVERLLGAVEMGGQRLQEIGALGEGHRPQRGAACEARVTGHGGEIEPGAGRLRHHAPVEGAGDGDEAGGRGDPAAQRIIAEHRRLSRGGDFGHVHSLGRPAAISASGYRSFDKTFFRANR